MAEGRKRAEPRLERGRRAWRVSATHGTALATVCGLCATLLVSSCAVRRELVLTSEPPGAIVRLDERIVGTTPYRHGFEDYGSRRVTLYRSGYRTTSEVVRISPPWFDYFPLDFISEVLFPIGWKDTHEFHFQLEPDTGALAEPDIQPVLERAERLRKAGPEGPQPPKPPKTEPPG